MTKAPDRQDVLNQVSDTRKAKIQKLQEESRRDHGGDLNAIESRLRVLQSCSYTSIKVAKVMGNYRAHLGSGASGTRHALDRHGMRLVTSKI